MKENTKKLDEISRELNSIKDLFEDGLEDEDD